LTLGYPINGKIIWQSNLSKKRRINWLGLLIILLLKFWP